MTTMTRSLTRLPTYGGREPTFSSVPGVGRSLGPTISGLARSVGLTLDPWQADFLTAATRRDSHGTWTCSEVAIFVPRQNGKNGVIEARQLAGLYLPELGETQSLHTAHKMATAKEHYRRLKALITSSPALMRRRPKFRESGEECSIEILGLGTKLRFLSRATGGGRGFTGDVLYIDEALYFTSAMQRDLMPTVSARPSAQVFYMSSPPHEKIVDPFCWDLRDRALAGDPEVCYVEWSLSDGDDWHDPATWIRVNPGYGRRLTMRAIKREYDGMRRANLAGWAVERLGLWLPKPVIDQDEKPPAIEAGLWQELVGEPSLPHGGGFVYFVDSTSDQQWTSIAVAYEVGGKVAVEIAAREPGILWALDWLADRVGKPLAVGVSARSAASALVGELATRGVSAWTLSAAESMGSVGSFIARVRAGTLVHLGDPVLDSAVLGARTRLVGEARDWDSDASTSDISPLRAVCGAAGLLPKAKAHEAKNARPVAVVRGYR